MKSDVCVFINQELIIAIYVDDIIIAGKELNKIETFKEQIGKRFKTKDWWS